ncbi:unnamed protein product [Protopolystoma xenopodis]|uniref:Uncharacterized protein n=1 Tax=Protopolystoma xenopodis TaxID=117903 RepID=A0A448WV42_9PLAT|nr:unnamed protein product [Protopolystoma xenopodis]
MFDSSHCSRLFMTSLCSSLLLNDCPGSKRLLFTVFVESPSLLRQYAKIIANSYLFQSPVHQVSLKVDFHSLPDLPVNYVQLFPIIPYPFFCIVSSALSSLC